MKVKNLFPLNRKIESFLATKYYQIKPGRKTDFDACLLEIDSAITDLVELKVAQLASNLSTTLSKDNGAEFDTYRKIYRMQLLDSKHKELSRIKNGPIWDKWRNVSKKDKDAMLLKLKGEVESLKEELDILNERVIINENIKTIFKKYN